MEKEEKKAKANAKWGSYWVIGFLIAAVCIAVILYIGWFDNNDHVDSPSGDNVLESYETATPQPDAPGVNDWENANDNSLRQIIVEGATGTDTTPMGE